jgi:hypothetical protein
MHNDFLSIIEAGYAQIPSEQMWLQGIADAALPCLDQGLGVNAYTYDATSPRDFQVPSKAAAGGSPFLGADLACIVQEDLAIHPGMLSLYDRPGPPGL